MSTRFQYPTPISTDAAASTDQPCQIRYGVQANGFLLPSERSVVVKQRELSSDDEPQSGFLLEGPWFLGYRAQIADNSFNGSIVPQGSMPLPIARPVDQFSAQGAGGDVLVATPGVSAFVNPMNLAGPTSTSDSQQPPPGFFEAAPQNPTPSQESADDRQPCGWRGKHGDICNVLIGYHCKAHLASAHGIVDMSRTQIVKCGRCGKRMGRRSILRHYREKHLGFHR
ncbi:hypothetical protein PISMIDRAFT_14167 [Pisolithus microcarpus 441]|uniref:Uncharacterized protein n=1 Tax=Pisolithus microcarpus 441 TaxID=765257 RepID=A0A0C9ZFB3_9AGAM|nr:hypothetical protein BKA83DRAFT_14167 [Pisolithus microcarpus]KIK18668.1 hypothetical protein PISMIDRAFT_14167 [Pisolithus microcarpus 441]